MKFCIFVSVKVFTMKQIIIIGLLILAGFPLLAQSREVPFTLEDRDRLMRTEEKVESLRKEMNARFEGIDQRFEGIDQRFEAIDQRFAALESKIETLYWGIGFIIVIMLFLLGYIIWDRRTALHPVQQKTMDIDERLRRLEYVTREQAKKDPSFAELLKIAGLL